MNLKVIVPEKYLNAYQKANSNRYKQGNKEMTEIIVKPTLNSVKNSKPLSTKFATPKQFNSKNKSKENSPDESNNSNFSNFKEFSIKDQKIITKGLKANEKENFEPKLVGKIKLKSEKEKDKKVNEESVLKAISPRKAQFKMFQKILENDTEDNQIDQGNFYPLIDSKNFKEIDLKKEKKIRKVKHHNTVKNVTNFDENSIINKSLSIFNESSVLNYNKDYISDKNKIVESFNSDKQLNNKFKTTNITNLKKYEIEKPDKKINQNNLKNNFDFSLVSEINITKKKKILNKSIDSSLAKKIGKSKRLSKNNMSFEQKKVTNSPKKLNNTFLIKNFDSKLNKLDNSIKNSNLKYIGNMKKMNILSNKISTNTYTIPSKLFTDPNDLVEEEKKKCSQRLEKIKQEKTLLIKKKKEILKTKKEIEFHKKNPYCDIETISKANIETTIYNSPINSSSNRQSKIKELNKSRLSEKNPNMNTINEIKDEDSPKHYNRNSIKRFSFKKQNTIKNQDLNLSLKSDDSENANTNKKDKFIEDILEKRYFFI